MKRFLESFLWAFLMFPFLVFFLRLRGFELPEASSYVPVLVKTILQAGWSGALSLLVGFLGAIGLLSLPENSFSRRSFQSLLFLPGVLPVLFVLVASLNIIKPFPYGFWGVVLLHIVVNSGLVAIFLSRSLSEKLGAWSELAQVEGASFLAFLKASFSAIRFDLAMMFLFVFSLCFVSFAIPLVVGSGEAVSLEVYIYDLIRRKGAWGPALWLSLLQSLLLFEVVRWLQKNWSSPGEKKAWFRWPHTTYFLIPGLLTSLIVLFGFAFGLAKAWSGFLASYQELEISIHQAFWGTLVVGGATGLLSLLLMTFVAYAFPARRLQAVLLGYSAPSSVLVGFAILMAFRPETLAGEILAMVFGITLISLPFYYRLVGETSLVAIEDQLEVAQSLGASRFHCFKSIVLPQVIGSFSSGAGLVAFWACGDFALSRIVSGGQSTLGLLIESLNLGYRLDVATYLCLIILVCGFLVYGFFRGVGFVLSRKSYL